VKVADFRYDLPEEAVAQSAVEPRHDSRLLDTRDMTDRRFLELAEMLAPGDLLVVNETRVRAARLNGVRRGTGGRVELLILGRGRDGAWEAAARPARRLRPGAVIEFDALTATVATAPERGVVEVTFDVADVERAFEAVGAVPLPPYFRGRLADPDRYQTMFAAAPGSAAAPTAGLHFTDEVVTRLKRRRVEIARVDLHVSLGTFRPMTADNVEDHRMHSEWCAISESAAAAVNAARKVIAVGTTVVRTLESLADGPGRVRAGSHHTDLFLRPGAEIQVTDAVITNFHMPGSTLVALVAAFMGDRWRGAYGAALERGYRFLSFGDAMYAERT